MSKRWIILCALAAPWLLASDARAGGPAARVGDMHVCPMFTGLAPHVGGPVSSGSSDVLIGGRRAARVGDAASCAGQPDSIATGSKSVLIDGKGAATIGSITAHGGQITVGFPSVIIGG